jgi:sarcosine oxidase
MSDIFDVIVIGAGAMGSAAAYHLAKDGQRALLLEQFEIGHARGSSHGESRIFRYAYETLDYARLAMQCKPLWRALEAEAGEHLLLDCDQIDLADDADQHRYVRAVAETLGQIGANFEVLPVDQVRRRYPQWRLSDDALVVLSLDSGILRATRCVQAMVAQAARCGAAVREREAVTKIVAEPGGVEVITTHGRCRATKLIITGGAWVNELLAHIGLRLPIKVSLEQYAYFKPRDPAQFAPARFPIFIHWRDHDAGYGFPVLDVPGVKIGFHHDQHFIQPSDDRAPREECSQRLTAYAQRYLPDVGEPFDATTCLYTTTPDEDFVIDLAPGLPNVAFCSACSGHGFKFAVGVGRALADLVQHGATEMQVGHVRLRRLHDR